MANWLRKAAKYHKSVLIRILICSLWSQTQSKLLGIDMTYMTALIGISYFTFHSQITYILDSIRDIVLLAWE